LVSRRIHVQWRRPSPPVYLGSPALTAERSSPTPTAPRAGRLYRTVDKATAALRGGRKSEFSASLNQPGCTPGFTVRRPVRIERPIANEGAPRGRGSGARGIGMIRSISGSWPMSRWRGGGRSTPLGRLRESGLAAPSVGLSDPSAVCCVLAGAWTKTARTGELNYRTGAPGARRRPRRPMRAVGRRNRRPSGCPDCGAGGRGLIACPQFGLNEHFFELGGARSSASKFPSARAASWLGPAVWGRVESGSPIPQSRETGRDGGVGGKRRSRHRCGVFRPAPGAGRERRWHRQFPPLAAGSIPFACRCSAGFPAPATSGRTPNYFHQSVGLAGGAPVGPRRWAPLRPCPWTPGSGNHAAFSACASTRHKHRPSSGPQITRQPQMDGGAGVAARSMRREPGAAEAAISCPPGKEINRQRGPSGPDTPCPCAPVRLGPPAPENRAA